MNINRLQLCFALVAGVLVSCQKSSDIVDEAPMQCNGVCASIDADTKVALSDETTGELTWISGDAIGFAGTADGKQKSLKLSTESSASVATFMPQEEDVPAFESLGAPYMGLYPFDSEAVFDAASGSVEGTLVQNQKANEIESSVRILPLALVARSQDRDNLNFYNVCSGIRFTVSGSNIVKVVFSGNDGEIIAGRYKATVGSDNEISVEALGMEETDIVLESPDGLVPGNMYYITFLPTEFTSGFKFEFEYADGHKLTTSCDIPKSVPRAIYGTIKEADDQSSLDKIFGGRDLAVDGITANCYIVTEAGKYKFPLYKGNSFEVIRNVDKVDVLWETYNSNDSISSGDLVSNNVRVNDGYVFFAVPSTPVKGGNALIAVRNSVGQILWSWHIWVCPDAPAVQKLGDIEFMDRNLGATSVTRAPECWGLMYQWGRKDPFPGACSTTTGSRAITTNFDKQPVVSADETTGTVDYALSHPESFIMPPSGSYDWIVGDHDEALWAAEKTKYDPCPAGWVVPGKDVWPERDQVQVNTSDKGVVFSSMPGSWFPATGLLDVDGRMIRIGDYGFYQTYSASGEQFTAMRMIVSSTNADTQYRTAFATNKAYGNAVRCVKE